MSSKHEQNAVDVKQKNVFEKPLTQLSSTKSSASNLPASVKSGFCTERSPIAATLTAAFLDFSSKNGFDLRSSGVEPGSRYCIEARIWKQAVDAGIQDVPRVKLEATHEAALQSLGLDTLKKWKAEQDNDSGVVWPKDQVGGAVRESGEIGGKEPRA
ncbi:hypothetical protein N0V90_004747 [Kalmusia sp. IMI 367209]|nr:hypothetical protein N0V90_004747 [Kalmusia sp. IMI 367209]